MIRMSEKHPDYEAMKKKLTKVKAHGKVVKETDSARGIPIWTLLPCRKMISPVNSSTEIGPKMYDDFIVSYLSCFGSHSQV